MKTMQRKFNILGMVLTTIVIIGLIIQYLYLNDIIIKEKQKSIINTREYLADGINRTIKDYSQYVNIMAELIGSGKWSDTEIEDYMVSFGNNNPLIEMIYFGDTNNKLLNNIRMIPPDGYKVAERPWYIDAVKNNKLIISDVYAAVNDGSAVVSISKPVYSRKGVFMGVMSSDISIEKIFEMVKETKIHGASYSFLIDGAGNILAHPNYKHLLKSELINIDTLGAGTHKEIQKTQIGQMEVELDGVKGYLSYRPIESTKWTIANFISLEDFKGNNDHLWRIFFIALMIAIIIFISFTYLQRKSLLEPLLGIDEDIKKINLENNIDYRLLAKTNDPFWGIKQTLNKVLDKTQDLFEQVEKDKEEILAQNENLNYLSYNDQLTGLHNRRYFEEQLEIIDVADNLPITIVMGDANGLKLINDSFGHKVGDDLLISVASIMKQGSRTQDIVSRISGDEFVIILPKTDKEEAEKVVETIQQLSKDKKISTDNELNIEISVSYGLGTKDREKINILDTLKTAEDNMYSNKLFDGPKMRRNTIKTILKELYKRDVNKQNHSRGVAMVSRDIGIELGMKQEELQELVNMGEVHDIGEIAINDDLLNKRDKLTSEEWSEIKKHPEIGYRILGTVNEMSSLAYYTLAHHERYDGTGYPRGLRGEEIPLVSRIVAIADAYDAMITNRPYRKALREDEVVREFVEKAGTQFDPKLAKIFVEKILENEWIGES